MPSPETANDALMDNEQLLAVAVSVGKIESTVTEIKENTNRRVGNLEQSVMTLSTEQIKQGQDLHGIKQSMSTSYKWMTALVSVIGIVVSVIMKMLLG